MVEYFSQEQAHCLVEVDGLLLPVEMPAAILRKHGLRENMRFEWHMSEDGSIRAKDIRPLPEPAPSEKERQELERRYQANRNNPAWQDIRQHLNNE